MKYPPSNNILKYLRLWSHCVTICKKNSNIPSIVHIVLQEVIKRVGITNINIYIQTAVDIPIHHNINMSVHSHTVSFEIYLNDIKNKAECITNILIYFIET